MSDFDVRLRARLAALEASAPAPAPPRPAAATTHRFDRRRQVVLLVAAALTALTVTAIGAIATQPPPDPVEEARNAADEQRVLEDLGQAFGVACLSKQEAGDLVRRRLDALGLEDWTVRADERISQARCVGAATTGDGGVLLTPSMGGDTAAALDQFGAELLAQCATRDAAVAQLRAVLERHGWREPRIEVGGIRGVPIDDGGAYVARYEAGCAVLAGAQFDHVGRYTWFVAAR